MYVPYLIFTCFDISHYVGDDKDGRSDEQDPEPVCYTQGRDMEDGTGKGDDGNLS